MCPIIHANTIPCMFIQTSCQTFHESNPSRTSTSDLDQTPRIPQNKLFMASLPIFFWNSPNAWNYTVALCNCYWVCSDRSVSVPCVQFLMCVRLCPRILNRSRCVLGIRVGHASCHISSDLLLWHVCMLEACTLTQTHTHTHRKCSPECVIFVCVHIWM